MSQNTLGRKISRPIEYYFMLNSASDYQTFIEIKDHFNVDCIHIPPCIERMGNLYSKYSEKTHLQRHFSCQVAY